MAVGFHPLARACQRIPKQVGQVEYAEGGRNLPPISECGRLHLPYRLPYRLGRVKRR